MRLADMEGKLNEYLQEVVIIELIYICDKVAELKAPHFKILMQHN